MSAAPAFGAGTPRSSMRHGTWTKCLCPCFSSSPLPADRKCHVHTIQLCRSLAVEFMHYGHARALRKVSRAACRLAP